MGEAVAEKRRAFEELLQRKVRVTYDRYRTQRMVVKRQSRWEKNGGLVMGRVIGD